MQIEQVQAESLGRALDYAWNKSKLVRSVWDRSGVTPKEVSSIDAFVERAPFLSIEDMRAYRSEAGDFFAGMLCVDQSTLQFIGATSGTTGLPMALPQHAGDARPELRRRALLTSAMQPGDAVLLNGLPSRNPNEVMRFRDLGFHPVVIDQVPGDIGVLVDCLDRERPVGIDLVTVPLILALQSFEASSGMDLSVFLQRVKWALFGGQFLTPQLRQTLESWGMYVRIQTSLGNIGTAVECDARDGCHVWEDLALVECVDPQDGTPVSGDPAVGELVVTSLADVSAPMVRYRTGDLVRLSHQMCRCGSSHGRIWPLGRTADAVRVEGRTVAVSEVREIVDGVDGVPSDLVQLVRARPGQNGPLRVRVGVTPSLSTAEKRERSQVLQKQLESELAMAVNVEMLVTEEMSSRDAGHKFRLVVDE
jgi:phenylacetate-CoA ligase